MTVKIETELSVPQKRTVSAGRRRRRLILRPLLDAAVAAIVFTLVSSAIVCNHAKAGIIPAAFSGVAQAAPSPAVTKALAEQQPLPIVQIATASSPADAVYRQTSVMAAWSLLGVAFSLLAALNLAMVRHLRRAYATPIRRFPPRN